MKKIIVVLFTLMVSAATFAGGPLKVINRKVTLQTLLRERAYANLVIDWSNAKYDKKKPLSEEFNEDDDYEFIQSDCVGKFMDGFNGESKGMIIDNRKEDASYSFIITVSNVDAFVRVMGFKVGKTEAKMWGNLKIVDNATNEVIAEIKIDEAEDGCDYVRRESFGKTFEILGQEVAKMK